MEVPISQFRREIFSLVNQALEGEEVWVTHKGRRVRIAPEAPPADRLSRITPMQILSPGSNLLNNQELLAEMTSLWEADWERDFGPAPSGQSES
jgi:antitoxin (DNA-binding transcriptional repressor) of toxin-antitoxin stability system